LFCIYSDPKLMEWLFKQFKASGRKLDMGKGCVRVQKLQDLPVHLISKTFAKIKIGDLIKMYEKNVTRRKQLTSTDLTLPQGCWYSRSHEEPHPLPLRHHDRALLGFVRADAGQGAAGG
jgi:hypothetical protein